MLRNSFLWCFLQDKSCITVSKVTAVSFTDTRCYSSQATLAELRSRTTETKQTNNLKLLFNASKSTECLLRSKIKMSMRRKTQKVHGRLLKRRPGSTSEISSVLFTQLGERRWSCTGSHHLVLLGKKERKIFKWCGYREPVKLLRVPNCTCLQKQLRPFQKRAEPGHELQAYVCRLYKVTTPSVFREDQVVKEGGFLTCQIQPSLKGPLDFRGSSRCSALSVTTKVDLITSLQESPSLYTWSVINVSSSLIYKSTLW